MHAGLHNGPARVHHCEPGHQAVYPAYLTRPAVRSILRYFAADGHDDALKVPFGGILAGSSPVSARHFRHEVISQDAVRPFPHAADATD